MGLGVDDVFSSDGVPNKGDLLWSFGGDHCPAGEESTDLFDRLPGDPGELVLDADGDALSDWRKMLL